ncbi:EF-hand_domain pair-containing protein [Hexamita inflata]|uniref:EF-hand domain pair-containing protein n=1 Tax=Hexamita inflata TaxID=28002 RepID=A0AA86PMA9_9EUKA|nr:EF-hand domain pair-containing protein [Hexamita inflata]
MGGEVSNTPQQPITNSGSQPLVMPNEMQLRFSFNEIDSNQSKLIPVEKAFSSEHMPKLTKKQQNKTEQMLGLEKQIDFASFMFLNYFLINSNVKDQIRICFVLQDKKCSGYVNQSQLQTILSNLGYEIPTEAVHQLCEKCVGANTKMGLEIVQNIVAEIDKQCQ